jgi:hypothetical protein
MRNFGLAKNCPAKQSKWQELGKIGSGVANYESVLESLSQNNFLAGGGVLNAAFFAAFFAPS